jgi:hypothetical protein
MRLRHRFSRRHRLLWVGIALFCLLFQQQVMAQYVCMASAGTSAAMPLSGDCAAMMKNHVAKTPDHAADPRCAEHCASHVPAQADARVPMVPPLILPFASPVALGTAVITPRQAALPDPALQRPQAPPLRRFCSLLI